MGFSISPGITVNEIDLTTTVPSVGTTEGAFAGVFRWGPVGERILVSNEGDLVQKFGKPTDLNAETFFTAANFLAYSNKLYVVRAGNTSGSNTDVANTVLNAVANNAAVTNANMLTAVVKNSTDYLNKDGSIASSITYVAKYPGDLGNSLKVSVCDSVNAYSRAINLFPNSNIGSTSSIVFVPGSNTATVNIYVGSGDSTDTLAVANEVANNVIVGDLITAGNTTLGTQDLKVTSIGSVTQSGANASVVLSFDQKFTLAANVSSNTVNRKWEYYKLVDKVPGTSKYVKDFGNTSAVDEIHIVVADQDGKFTGVPGQVLEVYSALSRATDAKTTAGATLYYKNVLNNNSKYIWYGNARSGAAVATSANVASSTNYIPATMSFINGNDGQTENTVPINVLTAAYDLFSSSEVVDISLVLQGVARGGTNGELLANYIVDNICEFRKDCMAVISPEKADVVNQTGSEVDNIVAFRNSLTNSSYSVLDTGYKFMYDRYNDTYRYVPLNGDIAGLIVKTDQLRDAWWSPAGFNRGNIKNVVKLAFNPNKAQRDILYKSDINPVVSFPGEGHILYGDKTLLGRSSAFDRINVRRLFIVLEKAIAIAAKGTLFEFNDEFTRARFVDIVEPYLRDVQGRRGIIDYRVACDDSNNTAEVIDRNEFVADILIKPNRSINTITLNFVAVRSGVEFSEIESFI